MNGSLAIVIPAYKPEFLNRTLESLLSQTNQRFSIYIGDDASPANLASLCRETLKGRKFHYIRFDSNLGGKSLVRQWDRCIRLSQEPWVWLFSDDDVMEPGCVAAFYRTLADTAESSDLYRFNTVMMDASDNIRRLNPPHPQREDWRQFAYFLLRNLRVCTQQECIFRRQKYLDLQGFLDLPLAWGSDHAFVIGCGTDKGLVAVNGPRVRFRQSGANISSSGGRLKCASKIQASMDYVRWLMLHLQQHPCPDSPQGDELIRMAAFEWFEEHLRTLRTWYGPQTALKLARFMSEVWGESLSTGLLRLLRMHLELGPYLATRLARRIRVTGKKSWDWN